MWRERTLRVRVHTHTEVNNNNKKNQFLFLHANLTAQGQLQSMNKDIETTAHSQSHNVEAKNNSSFK
jgi:hypothetical protein